MCIFSFSSRFGAKGLSQNKKWEKKRRSFRTVFAAESGEIRKNRTFSNLRGLNLCTSHILVFDCLHGQDVVRSLKKVAENIPGTNITRYYLRRHLHRVIGSRRHLYPKSPETFESKLGLFWLKNP